MIYNHRDYIKKTIPNNLDHIKCSKKVFEFVLPPKYDEDTVKWGNGLKEIAETKINELLDRYDFIENRYKHNTELIHHVYDHLNDFSSEFFLYFEALDVSEAVYLNRWLRYWKRIYECFSEEKLIEKELDKNRITEQQIDQAKEIPIDELYQGNLKITYGKAIGLCPFHEEKTPSFTIFLNENTFHCFGCQAHGDSIEFHMKINRIDFIQAVKELLNE